MFRLMTRTTETRLYAHVVVVHVLQGVVEVRGLEELAGEGNDARAAVVDKVDEHVVVGAALEHAARANALHGGSVALDHLRRRKKKKKKKRKTKKERKKMKSQPTALPNAMRVACLEEVFGRHLAKAGVVLAHAGVHLGVFF